jgi:hypothetical protein
MGASDKANTLVLEGLLDDYELKNCKTFHSECNMTQCYKCTCYGHIALACRYMQRCRSFVQVTPYGSLPNCYRPPNLLLQQLQELALFQWGSGLTYGLGFHSSNRN